MRISIGKGVVYIYDRTTLVAMVHHGDIALARKMAAAPDLLQAARCALADLEGIMDKYDPDGYHPGWTAIGELRVAIAKAEGG